MGRGPCAGPSGVFPFKGLVVKLRMTREKSLEGYREIWTGWPGSKSSAGAFFVNLVQTAN